MKRVPNKDVIHNCIDCNTKVIFKRTTPTPRCKICKRSYLNKKYRDKYPQYRKRSRESAREWRLKNYYGITSEEYNIMLEKQVYSCYICKHGHSESNKLVVDHNHKTGKIRGLLCHHCNRALGLLKDDIFNLERAIEYLTAEKK